MRFVCDSCRAQYMISDEKVGPKGVKVRCKKCGYVILVKKADASAAAAKAPPTAPMQTLGDPDDGMATQVMQNPLTGPAATLPTGSDPENTNPGMGDEQTHTMAAAAGGKGFLGGVDEDEIGAVFDQVLNSGAHSIPKEASSDSQERPTSQGPAVGDDGDDRMSTRVLDASVVKKLAEESGQGAAPAEDHGGKNGNGKPEVPRNDWFVAIDDKQTGPLTLDKIKEHWERGEVGPDSLCWRAGFSDWIPLSEVTELAAELAPRPKQPMIVSSPQTVGGPVPNLISVPVESAFSAGGVMKSVRSEVQVPLAASAPEETGNWRPSAASALASLVKDEMDALAKPAPKKHVAEPLGVGENVPSTMKGLLDLPPAAEASTNGRVNGQQGHSPGPALAEAAVTPSMVARGPANPYIANPGATYSSPGVSQYRPASNRNVTLGIIVGGAVAVLALVVVIVYLVTARQPVAVQQPVVMQPPAAVVQPPVAPQVAVAQPVPGQPPVAPAQPTPGQPVAVAQPTPGQPVAVAQPTPGQPVAVAQPTPGQPVAQPGGEVRKPVAIAPHPVGTRPQPAVARAETPKADRPEPVEKSKPIKEVKGGDDDFNSAFGAPDPPAGAKKGSAPAPVDDGPKKKTVFIPEAPGGGGNMPDTLGQSDIMEVVLANKPGIAKCVEEQRKKEPGLTGKLVMKWTIQTSGKTSNVQVNSEEFKTTYIAGCVGGLVKSWSFPRHKTQGEPVVFPFKF